ncbi:hypothetical protein ACFLU8_03885 [Chloroflexota bacterium]
MPAIVGLIGYANLSASFRDGDTLVDVPPRLTSAFQDLVTTTEFYSRSVFGCDYTNCGFQILT